MRNILAHFCLYFGFLITALGIALMLGWTPVGTEGQELEVAFPLLLGYAATAILTFPVYRVNSGWPRIFGVTAVRKKVSRLALILSILTFGTFLFISLLVRWVSGPISNSLILRLIGSLISLNGIYFVIHWAYRPENILERRTLILLNNLPLAIISAQYRRNAAKVR